MAISAESSFFAEARQVGRIVVKDPPNFDLESYISNYKGRTRFDRLFLIGTSSTHYCLEALKAAVVEAKSGIDTARYEIAISALQKISPGDPDATADSGWISQTTSQVQMETNRLEAELKGYKNNLIKECIRLGYDDLGQHYHRTGDLMNSAKAYQKMRDFCTMPSHIVVMYLRIINVSIDQGTWLGVQSSIQKIRSIGQKESQAEKIAAKLSAALGLSYLCTGNYREAAETFLDTDPSMVSARMDDPADEEAYNEVLTPNDIAVYGGLASLASMDRDELQKRVLENFSFRTYLELEPHIRRAISSFVSGKYSSCLSILDTYRPDYLLDLHLQKHVGELYNQIRSKAIQQFFIPYSHVTFVDFAAAFNTDVTTIEKEVIRMIQAKTLEARIDLVNKVVMAYRIDPRRKAYEDAMKMAKFFNKALYLRHIHMVMVNAGMEVKAPKGQTSLASLEAQTSFHANTLDALLENTGRGGRTTRSCGRFA